MNKYTFMGNGRNKDFYFTFSFFSKGDIVVKINGTVATGYGVFCIQGTGNNDFPFTGGHIHFATAPKSTDIITIERKLQLNRIIDYQPTAELTPTIVNQDMNYFFELLKDIKSDLAGFQETYAEFTDTESAQTLLERIDAVMDEIDIVSEQIENLGDITTIRTNISELGTSVTNLTNSLNSLTSTVGGHTTSIGALDTFKNNVLDYVIASQTPTSENNYTWYRKYKSGWVEQGGTGATGNVAITLPIEMADANYTATMPGIVSYSVGNVGIGADALVITKTATSIKYGTNSAFGFSFNWYICGVAA